MASACHRLDASATTRHYQRRRPERSALYRVIGEHWPTVCAEAETQSTDGSGYPRWICQAFEGYLKCGQLAAGFSRLVCASCPCEHLLPFSCKGRFCPSCNNRRMEQTAEALTEQLLPQVAYRQFTLSLPFFHHTMFGYDAVLLGQALRVFIRTLAIHQRRQARRCGIANAQCGAIAFIHRFTSALRLCPHFHVIIPDGVFVPEGDHLRFEPLDAPTDDDIERLAARLARRIDTLVGAIRALREHTDTDANPWAEHLAEASALPSRRPWHQLGAFRQLDEAQATHRCHQVGGFSLHANVAVGANDRQGLRRLLRYGARGPLAQRRVSLRDDGLVSYALRKPTATGQKRLLLSPQAFIRRLVALLPPPWLNLTRAYGVFASASKHRKQVIALLHASTALSGPTELIEPNDDMDTHAAAEAGTAANLQNTVPLPARITWSELLRRTFDVDALTCPRCNGRMRLIAVIEDKTVIRKILSHLHLLTDLPKTSLPRAPPQTDFGFDDMADGFLDADLPVIQY